MITREKFVAEARSWVGVRWLHQGRTRAGVDCIGLVLATCWALGLTDYDVRGYGRSPDADFMRREADRLMTRTDDVQPGDVYLMRFAPDSPPQHLAIATDHGLLHAWATARRVAEVRIPPQWRELIVATYRIPGVG